MSSFDYLAGRVIAANGHPFYAVIQAAMRQADTANLHKLKVAFPETWDELQTRYNAPGGTLPTDAPVAALATEADAPATQAPRHAEAVIGARAIGYAGRDFGWVEGELVADRYIDEHGGAAILVDGEPTPYAVYAPTVHSLKPSTSDSAAVDG